MKNEFELKFDMGNDAFMGGKAAGEVVRILRDLADRIERNGIPEAGENIYDLNGNDIGFCCVDFEDDADNT